MPEPGAPPAPPPVVPPPATPHPAAKARVSDDPFVARILSDMGKVVNPQGVLSDAPIAPAPEVPQSEKKFEITSMGEHARFKREREESAAKKEATKPAEAPPVTPPEDGAPAVPPPVADKPIPVEKAKPLEEVIEGVVKRLQTSPLPAKEPKAEEKPPEKAAEPDAGFIDKMTDEQRDQYDIAMTAAKYMPDKYGQQPKRYVEYLKKVEGYVDAKLKEDPDWDSKDDEAFTRFQQDNRPAISRVDQRRVEHDKIKEETRAEVEKEFRPRFEESDRQARVLQAKPEIDGAIHSYKESMVDKFAEGADNPLAPVMAVVKEKGWKAAAEADPDATAIAQTYANQAEVMGKEYLELATGLKDVHAYDPKLPADAPANQHAIMQDRLLRFVENQENVFAQGGGSLLVSGGKQFATRREFNSLPPAQRANRWTLSHIDVLEILSSNAASQAQKAVNAHQKRLADAGYVKAPKGEKPKKEATPPPATPTPAPVNSPKATTSPAPGTTSPPVPTQGNALFTADELRRQQSGGHASWS